MENANSPEYLEKIKIAVIENLKKTVPAPSVQMQDVPRHGMNVMTDEDDAELDDEDADNNKDVRMTQRDFEKRTVVDNEFEESDDEEMAEANGVYRPNGKRKTMSDFKNPYEHEEEDFNDFMRREKEKEKETQASPQVEAQDTVNNDEGDETMEDVEQQPPEAPKPEEATAAAPGPPIADVSTKKLDKDGDVDMGDAAEPEEAPSIKQEDADTRPTPTSTQPVPEVTTVQENGKPTDEHPKDNASPEPQVAQQEEKTAEATVPAVSEPKDAGEPNQEPAKSPTKISEPAEDSAAKTDVEEPKADNTAKTGTGLSREATAEN